MDTVASPLFDPEIESMLCSVLLGLGLCLALLIIFFAFLTVRIDGKVAWSWGVVWIPMWIVDAVLGYVIVLYFRRPDDDDEDEDEDEEDERRKIRQAQRRFATVQKGLWMVDWVLWVLFQIFIVVRLDGRVDWSAAVVFIPYFVFEGIHFVLKVVNWVAVLVVATRQGEASVIQLLKLTFDEFWLFALRLILFVLIAVRIDNTITCSWAVVFIPLYLVGLKYAVQLALSYALFSRLRSQPEIAHQGKMTVLMGAVVFVVVGALAYALIGLIARRLDGFHYIGMSNVFIPVFIALVSFLFFLPAF